MSVKNARKTTSYIDIEIEGTPPIRIEYKAGPNSISKQEIISQFIERDLFNSTTINQIQWRYSEYNLTQQTLSTWMKEAKKELNALPKGKKETFFPGYDELDGIMDTDIDDFLNKNFLTIFMKK